MTRREALRLLGATPLALEAQRARPNILMIYADDMGWGDVGFNGRTSWTTPNVDRLASQGTRFTRWYSGAVVCAPSRGCLLTGKYTIHNGVKGNVDDLPESEVTIAEALKPHGYRSALIGKWHSGRREGGGFTHPLDQGFDQTFGFLNAGLGQQHYPKALFRGREEVPASGYTTDIFSDEAVRFIRERRAQPYFLYLAYTEPHFRIEAPEEDMALYRGKFKEKDPADPINAGYAAMVHRLDTGIGRVLRALDESGQGANTLVVFTSDQGATFEKGNRGTSAYHDSNHPFRGQKRSLEEGGIRVPAAMRWPARAPTGRVSDAVIHMTDLLPTFLAAAGGAPDPAWKVDGMNILEVFEGKARPPDRTLFWEWTNEGGQMYAAMRGDFKLLDIGGQQFLYNVAEDPGERRTLAGEYPEMLQRLREELNAWKVTEVKR